MSPIVLEGQDSFIPTRETLAPFRLRLNEKSTEMSSMQGGIHIWRPQWFGGGGPQKADKRNKISWFVTLTRGVILRTSYMEAPYLGAQLSKRIRKCFPRKSAGLIFLRRLHCKECRQRRCGVVITLMAPLGLIYPSMWKTPAEFLGQGANLILQRVSAWLFTYSLFWLVISQSSVVLVLGSSQ